MAKRSITTEFTSEDESIEFSLRPGTLKEYIGQKKVKNNLKVYIEAAKQIKTCILSFICHFRGFCSLEADIQALFFNYLLFAGTCSVRKQIFRRFSSIICFLQALAASGGRYSGASLQLSAFCRHLQHPEADNPVIHFNYLHPTRFFSAQRQIFQHFTAIIRFLRATAALSSRYLKAS